MPNASPGGLGVLTDTWRALFAPRRLFVIVLIAGPMLTVQLEIGKAWTTLLLPGGVILLFLLTVPAAYRVFFALEHRRRTAPLRLAGFVAVAGLPPLISVYAPRFVGADASFLASQSAGWVVLGLSLVGGYGLGRDIDLEQRWQAAHDRAEALDRARAQTEVLALRAQLDPHFLFNTLNAIAEWCREDPEVAERALLDLSELLRAILVGVKSERWPLAEELALARRLFELHRVRDPELFSYRIEVPNEMMQVELPPMILLPLTENAMTHGPRRGHGGEVVLTATQDRDAISIRLSNPGRFAGRRPGGEGLRMVEHRLQLAYGTQAELQIDQDEDRTVALVRIQAVSLKPDEIQPATRPAPPKEAPPKPDETRLAIRPASPKEAPSKPDETRLAIRPAPPKEAPSKPDETRLAIRPAPPKETPSKPDETQVAIRPAPPKEAPSKPDETQPDEAQPATRASPPTEAPR